MTSLLLRLRGQVAMCAPVVQGYGLTETCAASFIGVPDDAVRAAAMPKRARHRPGRLSKTSAASMQGMFRAASAWLPVLLAFRLVTETAV